MDSYVLLHIPNLSLIWPTFVFLLLVQQCLIACSQWACSLLMPTEDLNIAGHGESWRYHIRVAICKCHLCSHIRLAFSLETQGFRVPSVPSIGHKCEKWDEVRLSATQLSHCHFPHFISSVSFLCSSVTPSPNTWSCKQVQAPLFLLLIFCSMAS